MDKETLKQEYEKFKEALDITINEVKALEDRHSYLEDERIIAQASIITAKRNKNEDEKNKAEDYLNTIDSQLAGIKEDLFNKKERVEVLKVRINMRVEALKENPQVAEELNTEMSNGYEARLDELRDEEEHLIEEKDRMENLKELTEKDPVIANSLNEIILKTATLNKIKKDLEKIGFMEEGSGIYSDQEKAGPLVKAGSKIHLEIKDIKAKLMEYAKQNNIDLTEKDIENLTNRMFVQDEKGKVDLNTTVDMNIPNVNRRIMSCENDINTNLEGMRDLAREQRQNEQNASRQPSTVYQYREQPSVEPQRTTTFRQAQPYEQSLVVTGNEPKWYQFIQRFKNWRMARNENTRNKEDMEINAAIDKEERLEELKNAAEERPELKRSLQYLLDIKKKITDRKATKSAKLSTYLLVGGTGALIAGAPFAVAAAAPAAIAGIAGTTLGSIVYGTTFAGVGAMAGTAISAGINTIRGAVKAVKNYQDSRIINSRVNGILNYATREGLNITKSEIQDFLRGNDPEKVKEIIDANIKEYRVEREKKDRSFEARFGYSPTIQRQVVRQQTPQRNNFRDNLRYNSSNVNTNTRITVERNERNSNDMER